jgi:hypothetical protein
MSGKSVERLFRFTFILLVILYSIFIIGIFLIVIKILLLFQPEIRILGVLLTQ